MTPSRLPVLVLFSLGSFAFAQEDAPRSFDPRLKIELFAEQPQIVTPTGIDVDHAGRVWAIESNTHFPPEGYKGHPTDRVLVMEDTNGDRKADKITVFKDGLTHTMSIAVKPVWLESRVLRDESREPDKKDGKALPRALDSRLSTLDIFIATRREILLCTDTDGDLKCDQTWRLVHLETKGNYPHNGLGGFAFDARGHMFFGFGENLGADYKIIGSDGTTLSGGGEGGNVYRCKPDGSKLERWATGFWNPHASCFDAFGRLFTVDNDPDSRPPCRLLHIIPHGDYGYRFRNGRKGTHPFTSWNGEIPGTLPMVSGTGEAPSGIVCYESDGFPDDYLGTLLVGSWGDHRIDKFVLKRRGLSLESMPQPVIKGGENFRPVGLALAPDGSLYFTDWVLKDYKLHGKGRVWRVSAKEEPRRRVIDAARLTIPETKEALIEQLQTRRLDIRRKLLLMAFLGSETTREWCTAIQYAETIKWTQNRLDRGRLLFELHSIRYLIDENPNWDVSPLSWTVLVREYGDEWARDPFSRTANSYDYIQERIREDWILGELNKTKKGAMGEKANLRGASYFLCDLARQIHPKSKTLALALLSHPEQYLQRAAVQWIGEENLKELRPDVEKVLASEPMTGDLFMACLASLSLLDGVPPAEFEKAPPVEHILPIVKDTKRSAALRATALRMLPPTQKELDAKLLGEMVASKDESLRREAVRTLAHSPISERDSLLRGIAADESLDVNLRADAVAGLAPVDHYAKLNDATRDLLVKLLRDKNETLTIEALRSLRSPAIAMQDHPPRDPKVTEALKQLDAQIKTHTGDVYPPFVEALAFAIGKRSDAKPLLPLPDSPIPANSEAGRRTFFHTNGAGCSKCHTVGGRGGQVGPDLTVIARTMDRQKLAESILEPSKEISPQFTTWAIETTSGKVLTGMLLGEEVNGDLRLGNQQGEVFFVPFKDIETRAPMNASIMPERLHQALTPTEFRDLIAYLETLK